MKRLVFFLALLLVALSLYGETITITVSDRDLSIPLEGVTISSRSNGIQTITDESGIAFIEIPEGGSRAMLTAELPGYQMQRVFLIPGERSVSIALSITDVIEGMELVVERAAPGKTDEQSGISVVMDKEDMHTTANFGIVEDIMSSIKTLPGVGFSGSFSAQPSIRGGYPAEMGAVLDGVYILAPWHWGGSSSIFNPNMVESAKMSHGVFSARYGRALSGLLEVTTVQPDSGEVRINSGISTTALDFFAQAPIGKKAGVFLGGKITYLESMRFLNDIILDNEPKLSDTIPTMPYIRDFYAKIYYEQSPSLNFSFNAFIGTDGIGVKVKPEKSGITTKANFDWTNVIGFTAFKINWMPTKKNALRFLGAWNILYNKLDLKQDINGSREYSEAFITQFETMLTGKTSYTISGLGIEATSNNTVQQFQGKLETDYLLMKNHILSFGIEEVFQTSNVEQTSKGWQIMDFYEPDELRYMNFSMDTTGNKIIHSAAYALWAFGSQQSTLQGELGIRGEHFYLWNTGYDLNTIPVANPRFSINWAPIRNRGACKSVTFSLGSGVFSQFSHYLTAMEKKYDIDDFTLGPDQSWFQVIGVEAQLPDTWSIRLEGYYKHYLKRLYFAGYYNESTSTMDIQADENGKGYTAGLDLMVRKKQGSYLDGYLSYSFIYSRHKNPMAALGNTTTTIMGDPLDEWYYPSFHRFHTLNLVLNWKPTPGFTCTIVSSLATGSPKAQVGEIEMAPLLFKGEVIEQYRRSSFYSDTLRTEISCPVNIRFSWSNYYKNSKIRWEYYIGAEDIFVNLYRPKTNKGFDPFTGEEIPNSDSADFNIGIPILSIGYKINY